MPTLTVQQAFDLALQHHQAGRLAEAEALYRQILAVLPNHAASIHYLGVIARQMGQHDLAVKLIEQAIALNPNDHAAHSNLGAAYRALGRPDEAIASFRRSLALNPTSPEVCNTLGITLWNRGCGDEAVAAFRQAVQFKPGYAEAWNNLGNVLRERNQLSEAVSAYRQALQFNPDFPVAHNNLGNALKDQGDLAAAILEYRRTIQLQPGNAVFHYNLGNALAGQDQVDEAIGEYRLAIQLNPTCPDPHNNLGNALKDQGELDGAIAEYRRGLNIEPGQLAMRSNLIYALHLHPGQDSNAITEEQQRWNRQSGKPPAASGWPHLNRGDPHRRLRIGYVSPDLRDHVVGRNLKPLFEHHDRQNFEIVCYAGIPSPDPSTDHFRRHADQWRSSVGLEDDAFAELIQQDNVDILVDLSQHTAGNRLPVFARQPAPVQVSFAGYPESTGVEAIGYRISDRYLEAHSASPQGRERSPSVPHLPAEPPDATERSAIVPYPDRKEHVFLIDSFWCYDPCGMDVEVNALPAKESGMVTFGSLNNFCKVNEPLLKLWARVLGKVQGSRLVMLSAKGSHRQRTLEFLAREGVEAQRVEFVEPRPRRDYLELYQRLDVVLDTFPYNGHTTSLDALWMGVPVVSICGKRAVSRAGLSQLTNLGLPELVASSEDGYVEIATQLAHDLPQLMELRRTLRPRMEASVLMDAPRFARDIEAAYRAMWRQWCAGKTGD